jgi:hypothetical protein
MKIFGLCCVRNAADIIGLVCAYHLAIGFARLIVADDSSTDGTREILEGLARSTGRIEVLRSGSAAFDQPGLTSAAAQRAFGQGADYVAPFDADEFIFFRGRPEAALKSHAGAIVRVPVTNFVQARSVRRATPLSLLRANHRPWLRGGEARPEVTERHCAFIEVPFASKVIAPARPGLRFDFGNHVADLPGVVEQSARDIEILHLPLRSREELERRNSDYEPRVATLRQADLQGWHSLYLSQCVKRGELDREWRANSQCGGALDVDGRSVPLIRDNRLRLCFLRALPILISARLVTGRRRLVQPSPA